MNHKPAEHDAWAKKKKDFWNNKNKNKNNSSSNKLTLTDSMKQALMTEANMSAEQAQACWSKVVSGN